MMETRDDEARLTRELREILASLQGPVLAPPPCVTTAEPVTALDRLDQPLAPLHAGAPALGPPLPPSPERPAARGGVADDEDGAPRRVSLLAPRPSP